MRSHYRSLRLIALLVPLVLAACAVPQADAAAPVADTVTTLPVADPSVIAVPVADLADVATVTQATRPADSLLFNEAQVSLKTLAWRVTDGKFRVTNRDNGAGPWEADIRDAVWKGLFYVTQPPSTGAAGR